MCHATPDLFPKGPKNLFLLLFLYYMLGAATTAFVLWSMGLLR